MAKFGKPRFKRQRRVGVPLGLDCGIRAGEKCRSNRPGMHGTRHIMEKDYTAQLRGKQIISFYYGVKEKQFRRYYQHADRLKGPTGENLLKLLEARLDNVVYRLGFASTRAEARQLVSHGAIMVNGQTVTVPSFQVKPGNNVEIRERAKNQLRIIAALELSAQRPQPEWLDVDAKNKTGVFKTYPNLDQLPPEFKNVNLVVELYSK